MKKWIKTHTIINDALRSTVKAMMTPFSSKSLILLRYMKGLRAIIDAMDDEISLAEQLKRIARAHIKWNIHKAHVMVSDEGQA